MFWFLLFLPAHLLYIKQLFLNMPRTRVSLSLCVSFSLSLWASFCFITGDISQCSPAGNLVSCLLVKMSNPDFHNNILWSMMHQPKLLTWLVLIQKGLLESWGLKKIIAYVQCVYICVCVWAHGFLIVLSFVFCFLAPSFPLSSLLLNKSGHVSYWGP